MRQVERDELLFLYAAGALEGEERDEVEAWLGARDPDVVVRLACAEAEVAVLARALAPAAPAPAVAERLRGRIEAAGAARAAPVARRSHRSGPVLAALAASIVAALLAGLAANNAVRVTRLERDLAAVRAELAAAVDERSALDEELAEQEAAARALETDLVLARKAIGVMQAQGSEALELTGTAALPGARGRVFWDWKEWYCYLHVEGLDADASQVYALWLFTDRGEVIGVGSFEAGAKGEATLLAPVSHDIGHVVRAGVSIEPDHQLAAGPRGEIILTGT